MGEYVQLGEVKTWYEVEGDGPPLVLLHGGMSDSTAWGMQVPAFSQRHRVFSPDRRAHGKTPDVEGPLSYDGMAADTVAFLETVVGGPAYLVGWSDGGIVALLVALRRPDLVTRQVVIGANFHHEGLLDAFHLGDDPNADDVALFKGMYEANAVDPANWPVFFAKSERMWREEPTMTIVDIARINAPTLVMVGDDDAIEYDHTVALFEALPVGQLAVVPGTSHVLGLEKPALVNQLVLDFLAETDPPGTFMPFRRASP
jgi:pimeloyl-ACP methyl ester carboxylesterase